LTRILITGGAGFIGSNFVRYMLNKHGNYQFLNLDKLTYAGNLSSIEDLSNYSNYSFVHGDICDETLVNRLMLDVDAVVNFAAESHVDRSIEDPSIFIKTNVHGTQILLEAARKNNISKFLQVSTDEVYGTLEETGLFTEKTPLSPNSPYSASKASADLLVQAYYHTFGLPTMITRCSNNYGPFQYPEKLIPSFIIKALNNNLLPIYGDGLNVRDWLYVMDHCEAIDQVLHSGRIGEVYNVGGNNEKTNIDITKIILQKLNKSESLISFVKDRLGHDRRYAIDSSKIKNELGWVPKVRFENGIDHTISWYLSNVKWLDSLNLGGLK
jgi:dTDP-glucose 4,6-dehydratase